MSPLQIATTMRPTTTASNVPLPTALHISARTRISTIQNAPTTSDCVSRCPTKPTTNSPPNDGPQTATNAGTHSHKAPTTRQSSTPREPIQSEHHPWPTKHPQMRYKGRQCPETHKMASHPNRRRRDTTQRDTENTAPTFTATPQHTARRRTRAVHEDTPPPRCHPPRDTHAEPAIPLPARHQRAESGRQDAMPHPRQPPEAFDSEAKGSTEKHTGAGGRQRHQRRARASARQHTSQPKANVSPPASSCRCLPSLPD
ncbi:salivary glue protein Sgs-3-like [Dicentrarchus labrax]|uniref:salivary glue protein Sgs-3-like n=1 Tax=Dicentrarchus labrax TaxID=13489 RepID=UPI0021F638B8|nr:salivary glue protein Sgs-3-like [Dicentrarchus labrax]